MKSNKNSINNSDNSIDINTIKDQLLEKYFPFGIPGRHKLIKLHICEKVDISGLEDIELAKKVLKFGEKLLKKHEIKKLNNIAYGDDIDGVINSTKIKIIF